MHPIELSGIVFIPEARKLQGASNDASAAIPLYVTVCAILLIEDSMNILLNAQIVSGSCLCFPRLYRAHTSDRTYRRTHSFHSYDASLFGAPRVVLMTEQRGSSDFIRTPLEMFTVPLNTTILFPLFPQALFTHIDTWTSDTS